MSENQEELSPDEEVQVEAKVKRVKSKTDKMPLLTLVLAVLAIVVSGVSLFQSSKETVSVEDFGAYQQTAKQSVLKSVSEANQADRSDIEALQSNIQILRQELEASKLDMSEKLAAQANALNLKISSLQGSLKKPQKRPVVNSVKVKPGSVKAKPTKLPKR